MRAHGSSRLFQHTSCGWIQLGSSNAPAFTNTMPRA